MMKFKMPVYQGSDFNTPVLQKVPDAVTEPVKKNGVAPQNYHATTIFPEYYKIDGRWTLLEQSRMDGVVVLHADGRLETGVSRVTGIHFEVDYSVKGY